MKLFLLPIVFILGSPSLYAQHQIIPAPVEYREQQGQFVLDGTVAVVAQPAELDAMASWLDNRLKASGLVLTKNKTGRTISLSLNTTANKLLGDEGYQLEVNPGAISLAANKPAGIYYGLQTLLQLMPADVEKQSLSPAVYTIRSCSITDYPRFGWRGLMLDVSRHFFTVDEVKQYIDLMAHYKFNVFHWHLTDDQGWRIQIKSFPKLTEIGGCRVVRYGTFGERIDPVPGEKATDCGYYTQEQVKDIVAYALARNVTIVPEIDVPGHSLAAIAAYPELSITKAPQMVSPGHKFSEWYGDGTFKMLLDNTLNPADEEVYKFLDKVFGEIAGLFPGKYIHAGGDECYHGYWEKSPTVQQFMKVQKIKDVHGLQSYFMTRVGKIIESKGKTMIGWDEILDGGLAPGAAVMSWRGMKGGIAAAKMGHDVVMSPTTHAYLDYMQSDPSLDPRIYAKLYLKTCFEFEPVPAGVDAKYILGGQGNLWTEKVPNYRHATFMTYPRAWAITEKLWSPKGHATWSNFVHRTEKHFTRANAANLLVSQGLYDPIIQAVTEGSEIKIKLSCEHPDAILYYTIDGSFPDQFSTLYQQEWELPDGPVTLKVQAYIDGKPAGRLLNLPREEVLKRK